MDAIKLGVIGGTGLAALLNELGTAGAARRHEAKTPFGPPSDAILETQIAGLPVLALSRHGPGHVLNPTAVPYRANIFALKQLGCTHIIASTAVGSLREEFKPRQLVIPEQLIDKTSKRPSTFFEHAAVHVEFAAPFCPVLRQLLLDAAAAEAQSPDPPVVHDRGCYVAMEGPAFSTRAESLMHRLWGGDVIGMTAMPEAKLAREAEISYALLCLVTDYDCWKVPPAPGTSAPPPPPADLLAEITANVRHASASALRVIRRAIGLIAAKPPADLVSPAHQALRLAIWSDKAAIDRQEVNRLAPLWMKYFDRQT